MQESKEQIDNDRSTGWPVLSVKIHKEQVKNYIISFLDRCHVMLYEILSSHFPPPPSPPPRPLKLGFSLLNRFEGWTTLSNG